MTIQQPKKKPFLGRAVQNGKIRFLSVSAIKQFDPESEGGCPRRWYFVKVLGKKEPESPSLKLGTECASELEHYLKTGEDILRPILRPGKILLPARGPDLRVEAELGDIEKALKLRDAFLDKSASMSQAERARLTSEIARIAGLAAGGIPLTGAEDFQHNRGEYVDREGVLRKEFEKGVVETGDHKTTSDIEEWAKTPSQLASDVQMLGYAVQAPTVYPDARFARLSHIYYQTRGRVRAEKRTALIPIEEALRKWERVDGVAKYMEDVATADRIEDVQAVTSSCTAFRGCPHKEYCPRTTKQSFTARFGNQGDEKMSSLFGSATTSTSQTSSSGAQGSGASLFGGQSAQTSSAPAASGGFGSAFGSAFGQQSAPAAAQTQAQTPQMTQAEREAEIARHRAKFEAEAKSQTNQPVTSQSVVTPQAAQAPQHSPSPSTVGDEIPVTACDPDKRYVLNIDGKSVEAAFIGPSGINYFFVADDKSRYKLTIEQNVREIASGAAPATSAAAPAPTAAPNIAAVNPPDAPPENLLDDAAPLSAEDIAKITDPAIRTRAEAHAKAHAERAAAEAASKGQTQKTSGGGRCPSGGQKVTLTPEQVVSRVLVCQCGKEIKVKPVVENGVAVAEVGGHNRPKGEDVVSTPLTAATNVSAPPPNSSASPTTQAATSSPAPAASTLFGSLTSQPVQQAPQATQSPAVDPRQQALPHMPAPAMPAPSQGATASSGTIPGLHLYVGVAAERGAPLRPLEDYYGPILRQLEAQYDVVDIRCAPHGSPLAFSQWKGALAAAVRATAPAPGEYLCNRGSEVSDIVVAELASRAERVFRGVR